jgi:hypothetical protein
VVPPPEAEIATFVVLDTDDVCTVKVALVAPAATVTLAGSVVTVVLLLESVTRAPPVGAAALNFTVPCEVLPPETFAGLRLSEDTEGGNRFSVAV